MDFTISKLECRRNCIISAFINVKTKEKIVFEISNRRNDYAEMVKRISKKNQLIVGYGNSYYDNIIWNFIIDNYYVFTNSDYRTICTDAFYLYQKIIRGENIDDIKYKKYFESIDLKTILFSKENRLSIQEIQASIQFPTISTLNFEREEIADIDSLRKNVAAESISIAKLMKNSKEYLQLRLWVFKELGIDCLSLDNVTSGSLILGKSYCQATNQNYSLFKEKKRYFSPVNINDIMFPIIKYETKEFNAALKSLMEFTIKKKYEYPYVPIVYQGKKYALTGGGLHSHETPSSYVDGIYIQADCISQYPSTINNYRLLDDEFDPVFFDIYNEAFIKKQQFDNDHIKREFFKIILNSYYGCLLNEHKPFFSPRIAFTVTINCQLLMLMLVEKLTLLGIDVISVNTDSIDVFLTPNQESLYYETMEWWCDLTKFQMTYKYANRVFRKDCNSYIMELNDKTVITKGDYNISNTFGKIHNSYVSKLASVNNTLYGVPIEETIMNHSNIYDFCDFVSPPEKGSLYLNDKRIIGCARYYASKSGGYLYKKFNSGKTEMVNGKFLYKTINDKSDIPLRTDLNMSFYIKKARTLNSNLVKENKIL